MYVYTVPFRLTKALPMAPPPLPSLDDSPCFVLSVDGSVRAGFPSPAEDHAVEPINLTKILVEHPQATFFFRVAGDSMQNEGIFDGDYVLIDRAVEAQVGHIVLAVVDNEYTLKFLRRSTSGRYFLEAANSTYPKIMPAADGTLEIWGVARNAFRALPGFKIRG